LGAVDVVDFDFELPESLIAQEPAADREGARLLHLSRRTGVIGHTVVRALPSLLKPGDVLVVNNSRVFPARLQGRRDPSGGAVECLLIERIGGAPPSSASDVETWEALVHPGQKLAPGARILFEGPTTIHGEVLSRHFFGRRRIRLATSDGTPLEAAIDAMGHVPLPPYIRREDRLADRDRYQTVYASSRGSVAAPTAGLHLTVAILDELRRRGVEVVEITLHVGYGTFQPVRAERVEEHRMEPERFEIGVTAASRVNLALAEGRRVVAVGTTTTRTLEAVAKRHGGRLVAGGGTTDLFIYPGFVFHVVGALLTNFHLPRSSLLMLVSAFAGRERVLDAYSTAIAAGYRFYSYGDAMLIE
jgi:S-adenosylmethionine:tRNA ribosyltransferase-isomerase